MTMVASTLMLLELTTSEMSAGETPVNVAARFARNTAWASLSKSATSPAKVKPMAMIGVIEPTGVRGGRNGGGGGDGGGADGGGGEGGGGDGGGGDGGGGGEGAPSDVPFSR